MKRILMLLMMVVSYKAVAQQKSKGAVPRETPKITISLPDFLDSEVMKNDINGLKSLKMIYGKLKRKRVSAVYQYLFDVDTTGMPVLLRKDESKLMQPINKYVEEKFVGYRWKPAHSLSCESCLVKTFGVLNFIFDTTADGIICTIRINNEKPYEVFRQHIALR